VTLLRAVAVVALVAVIILPARLTKVAVVALVALTSFPVRRTKDDVLDTVAVIDLGVVVPPPAPKVHGTVTSEITGAVDESCQQPFPAKSGALRS
jgi:hypothetical protein